MLVPACPAGNAAAHNSMAHRLMRLRTKMDGPSVKSPCPECAANSVWTPRLSNVTCQRGNLIGTGRAGERTRLDCSNGSSQTAKDSSPSPPWSVRMWFLTQSLVIATALIVKAGVALAIPDRFYAARQRQYTSTSLPPALLVSPAIILCLTSVAWYRPSSTIARGGGWLRVPSRCSVPFRSISS